MNPKIFLLLLILIILTPVSASAANSDMPDGIVLTGVIIAIIMVFFLYVVNADSLSRRKRTVTDRRKRRNTMHNPKYSNARYKYISPDAEYKEISNPKKQARRQAAAVTPKTPTETATQKMQNSTKNESTQPKKEERRSKNENHRGSGGNLQDFVKTNRMSYKPNEPIEVIFAVSAPSSLDWVTVVPIGSPENAYDQYFYTNGKGRDVIKFDSQPPGDYEARLFLNGTYKLYRKYRFNVAE
ncbi:MAG: hypothetical protein KKA07_15430 [Bacteroidetes bacterium]|nr:hypothetical protein [Bacteroidota bacterium]MBU1720454.1 hypothetical protein [Bacteroidota bacterium]